MPRQQDGRRRHLQGDINVGTQQHTMALRAQVVWIAEYVRTHYLDPALMDAAMEVDLLQIPARGPRLRRPPISAIVPKLRILVLLIRLLFADPSDRFYRAALALFIAVNCFYYADWSFEYNWSRNMLNSVWDIRQTVEALARAIEPAAEGHPF